MQVFPFEYQRAMRQVHERAVHLVHQGSRSLSRQGSSISQADYLLPPGSPTVKSGHEVHDMAPIKDIEDVLRDGHIERRRADKVLDKTRYVHFRDTFAF